MSDGKKSFLGRFGSGGDEVRKQLFVKKIAELERELAVAKAEAKVYLGLSERLEKQNEKLMLQIMERPAVPQTFGPEPAEVPNLQQWAAILEADKDDDEEEGEGNDDDARGLLERIDEVHGGGLSHDQIRDRCEAAQKLPVVSQESPEQEQAE